MAQVVGLPSWAVKDAEVWFTSGSAGITGKYVLATITRVTKASVFVKVGTSTTERRFSKVLRAYGGDLFMEEHGQSDRFAYSAPQIWAKDAGTVAEVKANTEREHIKSQAIVACKVFTTHESQSDTPRRERAEKAIEALNAYLASLDG